LIIRQRIPEVVIGCVDTFSAVSGSGIQKLRNAGLKIRVGILEKQCRELNKRFFTRQERNRPFIILKWAETTDGFIGKVGADTPIQISGWAETRVVHKMRMEEEAVLVGYQTAMNDNPSLNNRYWIQGRQPLRVVVDFENSLPDDIHLKNNQEETFIFNDRIGASKGKTTWKLLSKEKPLIPQIIEGLNAINSLIVEGGAKTLQAFIDDGCWDEIHIWKSTVKALGKGIAAPKLKKAKLVQHSSLNEDKMFLFVPNDQSYLRP
jgi:diaminohydroxyphosphoribosylaminopyrimidine deaminase/5-amino-6-(5-phosphoribosylamino)uracil reductase